jgi:hypothetical protein
MINTDEYKGNLTTGMNQVIGIAGFERITDREQ